MREADPKGQLLLFAFAPWLSVAMLPRNARGNWFPTGIMTNFARFANTGTAMITLILSFIAAMALGYLLSRLSLAEGLAKLAGIVTNVSIYLLIFLLGAQTGGNEEVLANISSIGLNALLLATAGTLGSATAGWLLYRLGKRKTVTNPGQTRTENTGRKSMIESGTIITLASLAIGVAAGKTGIATPITGLKFDLAMCVLYILLISVGLGIGLRPGLKEMLRSIRPSILLLPICSIIFTLAFCSAASLAIRDWSLPDCLAVGSGLGYYSLSSVLIASIRETSYGVTLATALGAMALLSNIFRELMTLILTPIMARHMGPYAPVAAAGATAMDVCLPGILKSCGPDIIPAALVSGVLSDFSVPFLVSFFCSL